MKPIVYIYQEQIVELLKDYKKPFKGVAFEWRNENVFHVFSSLPKVAPTGYPSIALLVNLSVEEWNDSTFSSHLSIDLSEDKQTLVLFFCKTDSVILKKGFKIEKDGTNTECVISYVPSKSELYSRSKGLLETDVLGQKKVVIVGLGSFGSYISLELAKAGVGMFSLFDFDRIELSNISRHTCGIYDLGRFKTHAIKDSILLKNPYANVQTFEIDINNHLSLLKEECSKADLVICVTDENRSRSNINSIALEVKKRVIFGRAITRAEGGDVFRLRGGDIEAPCLACLIGKGLFKYEQDEKSNKRQVERDSPDYVSEEDKEAVIQVGLSSDIAPICNFIIKLSLVELSRGLESGISTLEEDLIADYYIWANRREKTYKNWNKLEFVANRPSILRWFGVRSSKDSECLICNNYEIQS